MHRMRWISDKTDLAVSQVEPQALVRLEVDEPAAASELVRIMEEPEAVLRSLLMRLGRHSPVRSRRCDGILGRRPLGRASAPRPGMPSSCRRPKRRRAWRRRSAGAGLRRCSSGARCRFSWSGRVA
jgi:hypothetical protein